MDVEDVRRFRDALERDLIVRYEGRLMTLGDATALLWDGPVYGTCFVEATDREVEGERVWRRVPPDEFRASQ